MIKGFQNNKKTFFSFIVGVIVAVSFFFLLQNPGILDMLQTNVLSLTDKDMLVQKQRDIGYKTIDNELDVYVSRREDVIDSLELEILFSQGDINFDFGAMTYQGSFERVRDEDGIMVFRFDHLGDIDYNQSLFELPFSGDVSKVLLGEVYLGDRSLSVGNLNVKNTH